MKKESAIKSVAASLGFFVIYAIVSNLLSLSIQLFYFITYSELRISDYDAFAQLVKENMQANNMLIGLAQLVLFLIIIYIIFKVKGDNPLARIRWNPVSKQTYILVALFAIQSIITLNILFYLFMPQSWAQGASEYSTAYTSGGFILNLLLVLIVGPLGEEVLMRGLMTGRLLGRLPLWFVVALPTILFGVGHAAGGMGQIIGTTITGLVFTLTFVWTNSLRTSVLAHSLNNLIAAFLPWDTIISAINTPIKVIIGIIGLIVTAFVAYKIYIGRNREITIS